VSEPPYLYPDYRSTVLRAPLLRQVRLERHWFELASGPVFGRIPVSPKDADLTRQHAGEPLGERIIVTGSVLVADGTPIRDTLIEVWQANSAGRYLDPVDDHPAPLAPSTRTSRPKARSESRGSCWTARANPSSRA
jgi:protocatechuate 3,4-dioxygenase beta subunit